MITVGEGLINVVITDDGVAEDAVDNVGGTTVLATVDNGVVTGVVCVEVDVVVVTTVTAVLDSVVVLMASDVSQRCPVKSSRHWQMK